MTELSNASPRLLGLPAWDVETVAAGAPSADTEAFVDNRGRHLRVRPVVVDATTRSGSLTVAEPYPWSARPAGWFAPARSTISPHAWLLAELVAVLLVGLVTAWVVDAGTLGVALVLAATGVGYRTRHALDATVHPWTLARDLSMLFSAMALAVAADLVATSTLSQSAAILVAAGAVVVLAAAVRRLTRPATRVLVVGNRASVSRAAMRWSDGRAVEVVAGVLTDAAQDGGPSSIVGVPTSADVDAIPALVGRHRVGVVMVSAGDGVPDSELRRLSWLLEEQHVELVVVDAVGAAAPHRVVPVRLGKTTALHVLPPRPSAAVRLAKTVFDRVFGLLLLVLCLPLLGVLVLLVRLDSPGAGLFRQVRVGRDGEPFVMFKLRTMTVDADRERDALLAQNEGAGPLFKIHDDPRVTRVGRLLRRTSLDELAQLINVVRGDMSLIGPRPALPTEVAHYDDVERRRLAVRPGITGLWQVSGRSDLSWDASMALDLQYSDNYRLRGDASILARTFGAVVRRRGAY